VARSSGRGGHVDGAGQGPWVVAMDDAAARLGGREIWGGVDFTARAGELVAVLGPNGAGKSTLLRVLLGLLEPAGGSVRVLGGAPGTHNEQIGYLPQRRVFDSATRVRGVDLVRMGLDGSRWGVPLPAVGPWAGPARAARGRVQEVIAQVGAQAYARRPIGECSGGEQQRLLIAQALVQRPRLLILDEPLDGLDIPNQVAVTALVQRICRSEGVAVLLVAHDVNPLLPYLDRILYLAGGKAAAGTPGEVITAQTLSALYGTPIEVLRTSDGRMVVVGQPEGHHAHGPRHVLE
jgi:zinc/manganese transport system ATP-binding protein